MSTPCPSITLRRATAADIERIESLLRSEGLPYRDIRDEPSQIRVATHDQRTVGIGGLQPAGSNVLLRSLVVKPVHRGQGYGAAICSRLEETAAANDTEAVYLLTTTAPEFFRRRGYERVERELAPTAIQNTAEFQSLCPRDAICMRRSLSDSAEPDCHGNC